MTLPSLLLATIMATMYSAGFHVWQGGSARRLLLYLLAGWLGFALGHSVAGWLGFDFGRIGPLNFVTATLGSWIALFAARWLATSEAVRRP